MTTVGPCNAGDTRPEDTGGEMRRSPCRRGIRPCHARTRSPRCPTQRSRAGGDPPCAESYTPADQQPARQACEAPRANRPGSPRQWRSDEQLAVSNTRRIKRTSSETHTAARFVCCHSPHDPIGTPSIPQTSWSTHPDGVPMLRSGDPNATIRTAPCCSTAR